MAQCIDSSSAIVAGSGIVISGSGTPGNPWRISTTDPVDITDIENDIANILAVLATLPATYVNASGDTMTDLLQVTGTGPGLRVRRIGSDSPYIDFYDQAGARLGYVQASATAGFGTVIQSDVGLIAMGVSGSSRAYVSNLGMTVGKAAYDGGATVGAEMTTSGVITAHRTTNGPNYVSNKSSSANVDTGIHMSIQSAGTEIGRIIRATSTTSSFVGTSDGDLKENITPVDDELALMWMRDVEPVFYNYKDVPDVTHVGYVAQDMAEVWPNSVTNGIVDPGHGDVNDRTWDENGQETTPEEVWRSWMMDHGRLTPFLHSSMQALDRIIISQARQIATLKARVDALEAGVAPVSGS